MRGLSGLAVLFTVAVLVAFGIGYLGWRMLMGVVDRIMDNQPNK